MNINENRFRNPFLKNGLVSYSIFSYSKKGVVDIVMFAFLLSFVVPGLLKFYIRAAQLMDILRSQRKTNANVGKAKTNDEEKNGAQTKQ